MRSGNFAPLMVAHDVAGRIELIPCARFAVFENLADLLPIDHILAAGEAGAVTGAVVAHVGHIDVLIVAGDGEHVGVVDQVAVEVALDAREAEHDAVLIRGFDLLVQLLKHAVGDAFDKGVLLGLAVVAQERSLDGDVAGHQLVQIELEGNFGLVRRDGDRLLVLVALGICQLKVHGALLRRGLRLHGAGHHAFVCRSAHFDVKAVEDARHAPHLQLRAREAHIVLRLQHHAHLRGGDRVKGQGILLDAALITVGCVLALVGLVGHSGVERLPIRAVPILGGHCFGHRAVRCIDEMVPIDAVDLLLALEGDADVGGLPAVVPVGPAVARTCVERAALPGGDNAVQDALQAVAGVCIVCKCFRVPRTHVIECEVDEFRLSCICWNCCQGAERTEGHHKR